MAFASDPRDTLRSDGRAGIFHPDDVVMAVTIGAAGGKLVSVCYRPAMQRLGVLLLLLSVTGPAVHLCKRRAVGKLFPLEVGMAAYTGQ